MDDEAYVSLIFFAIWITGFVCVLIEHIFCPSENPPEEDYTPRLSEIRIDVIPVPQVRRAAGRRLVSSEVIVFSTYVRENLKETDGSCSICLEEYKDGETLAEIKACSHHYHGYCIKTWLAEQDTCPLCRIHLLA